MPVKPLINALAQFPDSHHLVVVTQKNVLAWNSIGLHNVFASESRGILAAKESTTGALAIADSHLVLLHEVKKEMEKSYRLKGAEGQVRLLHFSPGSDMLYFSTTLLNSVQRYSLLGSRLLEPGPTHPSPPVTLAVSSKSHILLSASESPPTVYLQSLTYAGAPKLFIPRVSVTAVTCAAFHPTRPNVFLLAFKDGSLGIYDTTRILRANRQAVSESVSEYAELKAFPKLHRVSSTFPRKSELDQTLPGTISLSITGAEFMPGSKSRVVTVGADGKCNIVDFERGVVVNSWHVKGPATTLSILALPEKNPAAVKTATKKLRKPSASRTSSPGFLIAIGRIDGKVFIFNESGAILFERTVDDNAERVINLDWIAGPVPHGISESTIEYNAEIDLDLLSRISRLKSDSEHASREQDVVPTTEPAESSTSEDTFQSMGTVRYEKKEQAQFVNPTGNGYMDLFSPVKANPPPAQKSPSRSRPRITSTTFVENGSSPLDTLERTLKSVPSLPPEEPSHPAPKSKEPEKTKKYTLKVGQVRSGSPKKVSVKGRNGVGSMLSIPTDLLAAQGITISTPSSSLSSRSTANSKILADIRQLDTSNKKSGARKIGGNLAVLAPYYESKQSHAKEGSEATSRLSMKSVKGSTVEGSKRKSVGSVKSSKGVRVRMRPRVQKNAAEELWLTDSDSEKEWKKTQGVGRSVIDSINKCSTSSKDSFDFEYVTVPDSLYTPSVSTTSDSTITRDSSKAANPQTTKEAPSSDPSSSSNPTTSNYTSALSTNQEATPGEPLAPGFAESYQGPVEVAHYLPRRASLSFQTPPRAASTPKRAPMADISGNQVREPGDASHASPGRSRKHSATKRVSHAALHVVCDGCRALCVEVEKVKVEHRREMEGVRRELEELRRLVEGR